MSNPDQPHNLTLRKLTNEQVLEILASPLSNTKLGALFGVSPPVIGAIRRGDSYREITRGKLGTYQKGRTGPRRTFRLF